MVKTKIASYDMVHRFVQEKAMGILLYGLFFMVVYNVL
jgi:hypothetical protein